MFARRGAAIQHGPVIRTHALGDDGRLRAATHAVLARRPAIAIANTGLGVRSWFSAAETWGLGEALTETLRGARIVARGLKAAGAAHAHGLDVDARPASERLHDAVDLVLDRVQPGDVVALLLDGRGANAETERLIAAGVEVIEVPVYVWELPDDDGPAVRLAESVVAGRVHALTFTAGPAVRNFMAIARSQGLDGEVRNRLAEGSVVVGCVGPVCAESARDEGMPDAALVVPPSARLGPLVRCVSQVLAARTLRLDVGGVPMALAGTTLVVDGAVSRNGGPRPSPGQSPRTASRTARSSSP